MTTPITPEQYQGALSQCAESLHIVRQYTLRLATPDANMRKQIAHTLGPADDATINDVCAYRNAETNITRASMRETLAQLQPALAVLLTSDDPSCITEAINAVPSLIADLQASCTRYADIYTDIMAIIPNSIA